MVTDDLRYRPRRKGGDCVAVSRRDADIYDMPMLGKEVNGSEVAAILTEFRPDHIWLEQVNAFGMGRTSAFTFGQGVGVLKGVFQSLKIPLHYGHTSEVAEALRKI
jgi:hypothetical protein